MNVHCKPLFSARLLMAQHTIDAFFNLEKAWVRFFAGRQFKWQHVRFVHGIFHWGCLAVQRKTAPTLPAILPPRFLLTPHTKRQHTGAYRPLWKTKIRMNTKIMLWFDCWPLAFFSYRSLHFIHWQQCMALRTCIYCQPRNSTLTHSTTRPSVDPVAGLSHHVVEAGTLCAAAIVVFGVVGLAERVWWFTFFLNCITKPTDSSCISTYVPVD